MFDGHCLKLINHEYGQRGLDPRGLFVRSVRLTAGLNDLLLEFQGSLPIPFRIGCMVNNLIRIN